MGRRTRVRAHYRWIGGRGLDALGWLMALVVALGVLAMFVGESR